MPSIQTPILFNIFLARVMSNALVKHDRNASLGGRIITNLQFADDIDVLAEGKQELKSVVESLHKSAHVIKWR